nr:ribonuclease H-like domain-containing protein [Tanacetum cinerariifolium]
MDTTIDQQVARDEALVPHAKRLRIGRSNFRLLSDIKSKESTLQLVYDVLRLSPFFKAFLVTADVLEIYMQEFWATTTVHHHSIRFKMDNKKHIVNLESFREMLHICPRLPHQPFVEPPFEEEILAFLHFLGHSVVIRKLTYVNINTLHQPWRAFAAIINKCLTRKSSGYDNLRHVSQAQQPPTSSPSIPSPIEPQPAQTHSMVMRSQSGIVKLIKRLSLHTSSLSLIPKSPFIALKDPNWCNAMYDEYNVLVKNGTRVLVPKPSNVNLIRSMWLFKHKFHADDTLSHYKARLVANGSNQQHGVDFDDTFSLVVKPATIRIILSLAVSRQWPIHQLDVKNEFLNGDLSETVYMHQPLGLLTLVILIMYAFCKGLFLSQKKYALQLLERAHMVNCKPSWTPVDTDSKLGPDGIPRIYLYMHDLREPHFAALKCILHYVQGTLELGLHLYASATTSLVGTLMLIGQVSPLLVAECQGVANVVAETAWLHNLLRELHSPLLTATLVYCDNISAVYMSANPVQHQRTKHIEIDIHFVYDMVKAGHVRALHDPSLFQYADIFTKGLPSALFEDLRSSLSVRPPPTQTTEAY